MRLVLSASAARAGARHLRVKRDEGAGGFVDVQADGNICSFTERSDMRGDGYKIHQDGKSGFVDVELKANGGGCNRDDEEGSEDGVEVEVKKVGVVMNKDA